MNIITRGIRNAFRNIVRTISIAVIIGLSIGLSLAMLVAHQAVGQRIAQVQSSIGNTISIMPAGIRGFDGGGNPLTIDQLAKVKAIAHVTSLDESLVDRMTTSDTNLQSAVSFGQLGQRFAQRAGGGGFGFGFNTFADTSPPVMVIGTTNPTNLANTQGGGTFTLKSGSTIDGTGSDKVALIGTSLATKNNLQIGSTFSAYGQNMTVAGIFDSGNTFSNNLVVMPLATLQQLSAQAGAVTSATVTVDSLSNLDSTTTAIKNQLGNVADVVAATDRAQQVLDPLRNVQTISLYSLVGAVAAGAVIILLSMVMVVRERRREIGVLKAMGASNRSVIGQFVSESLTLTLLGALVGVTGGFIAANPITQALVTGAAQGASPRVTGGFGGRALISGFGRSVQTVSTAVGWNIMLYGLVVAIIIAVVGSTVAAFLIAQVKPAEVMRTE